MKANVQKSGTIHRWPYRRPTNGRQQKGNKPQQLFCNCYRSSFFVVVGYRGFFFTICISQSNGPSSTRHGCILLSQGLIMYHQKQESDVIRNGHYTVQNHQTEAGLDCSRLLSSTLSKRREIGRPPTGKIEMILCASGRIASLMIDHIYRRSVSFQVNRETFCLNEVQRAE